MPSNKPNKQSRFAMLKKADVNKIFKTNQERFRLLNRLKVQPKRASFVVFSGIGILIAMIPLCFPDMDNSAMGWLFWGLGLFVTVGFEQLANYHYWKYSKIANHRDVASVIFNVRVNKTLRMISLCGWVLGMMGLALMIITKDGSLASLWSR